MPRNPRPSSAKRGSRSPPTTRHQPPEINRPCPHPHIQKQQIPVVFFITAARSRRPTQPPPHRAPPHLEQPARHNPPSKGSRGASPGTNLRRNPLHEEARMASLGTSPTGTPPRERVAATTSTELPRPPATNASPGNQPQRDPGAQPRHQPPSGIRSVEGGPGGAEPPGRGAGGGPPQKIGDKQMPQRYLGMGRAAVLPRRVLDPRKTLRISKGPCSP